MSAIYIVDTCSLFALKDFPDDVFPTLWANLNRMIGEGRFLAPHEVFREVERGDDEIRMWARERRRMFVELDEPTRVCIEEVLQRFDALRDPVRLGPLFADPVLVALCLARTRSDDRNTYFVVSEERMKGPGSLKIPNLCEPFGLPCLRLMDAFRAEGFRF